MSCNIILLGAPGSGKGTQAALLSKSLQIPSISTGEILRGEVASASEVGKKAKSYMDAGGLVPDEVVVEIVKKRISEADCKNGFILDGFPRNLNQGEVLQAMLESIRKKVDLVLDFSVADEVIVKRISGRFACKKCNTVYNRFFSLPKKEGVCDNCAGTEFLTRADDNEDTVKNRLKVYRDNSRTLIDFYQKKSLLYSVDGLKNVASIFEEISAVISDRNKILSGV